MNPEAESHCRRALALCERAFGSDHKFTLEALGLLSRLLEERGDWAGAYEMLDRAFAAALRTLGSEHAMTLTLRTQLNQLSSRSSGPRPN
jgi:hypothetical protein